VSGIFANGTPRPMVTGIAISALIAFAIARVTLPTENARLPAAVPEENLKVPGC
jgi:MFS transporter, DHA1 family, multidrug resistance protein